MKWFLAVQCLWLLASCVTAAPPVLPQLGDSGLSLSSKCMTPKCPETKDQQTLQIPVTLPYPLDCLQYIICNGSEARIVACPPDTVYDKTKGVCAPQATVKCVPCHQEPA